MKIVKALVVTLAIIFWIWFFVSWTDIAADNFTPNPQHYDWNLFVIMTNR